MRCNVLAQIQLPLEPFAAVLAREVLLYVDALLVVRQCPAVRAFVLADLAPKQLPNFDVLESNVLLEVVLTVEPLVALRTLYFLLPR